jgi:carbon-monoxide dehydrogenase medium subunit
MILPRFNYYSPGDLPEALDILAEKKGSVLPLAGGTDILVMMKEGSLKPKGLLSLKKIDELTAVNKAGDERLGIGAGTTVSAIEKLGISRSNPAFGDLIWEMATRQVRNRATIGGNLCTAAACADFPPVLLINDASVLLKSKSGEREVPIETFFTGPRQNIRKDDELLIAIYFKEVNRGSAYVKFGVRKAVKISIVGIACSLQVTDGKVSDIKIATTASSPTPFIVEGVEEVTLGKPPVKDTWEQAAEVVARSLSPISDLRGSADYRRRLGKVGTIRALDMAYHRLTGVQNV